MTLLCGNFHYNNTFQISCSNILFDCNAIFELNFKSQSQNVGRRSFVQSYLFQRTLDKLIEIEEVSNGTCAEANSFEALFKVNDLCFCLDD